MINGRNIGPEFDPYVIAEMSGNHNQDIERVFKIMEAAKAADADAVKIQTYLPETITINHDSPEFFVEGGIWHGRRLWDLYEEAHTPWIWHEAIFSYGKEIGITVFSSPFDFSAVDLLESLGAPAYKIASPEIIDLPLIRRVGETGKPVILSTGMANLREISEAVETARSAGASDVIVLHCTSAYPAPLEEANLATIAAIAEEFGLVTGLSDHTKGNLVSTLATVMGADVIEKHLTLRRSDGGIDSSFSLEPDELQDLVLSVRTARRVTGRVAFGPTKSEESVLKNRRSLYVVAPMTRGEEFTRKNIRSIRPGNGMKPKYCDDVIGEKASRDIKFGEALDESMIQGDSKLGWLRE